MSDGAPPLVDRYRALICDLDGVVYRGGGAVPGAVETLRGLGLPIVYATNNASRTPADVASHLQQLGLAAEESDVVTSSTAAATVLARELEPGTPVLAVGGEGVAQAVASVGLRAVGPSEHAAGERVEAVVQGYGATTTAADLAEAAYAVQAGARWVATNDDRTLPTDRGMAPGNGSLVAAVRLAVDHDPEVVGKPYPAMYAIAAEQLGLEPGEVLAVGDRLETDIGGAVATGTGGLLVLTGVHGWADAAAAPATERPHHVVADLTGLLEPYPGGHADGDWSCRGEARARVTSAGLETEGDGEDLLRAALDALWAASDAGEREPGWCRAAMEGLLARAGVA